SAREVLYLSYVGQSIRDNAPLPPSVLVSELLDYVRQAFLPAHARDIVEELVVHHPLQPFSPRYFGTDPRLYSYADDLARAAGAARERREEPPPLLAGALPAPEPEWHTLTTAQLARFFPHPARYLLRERLGILLEEADGLIAAHEPFELDRAGRNDIRAWLHDMALAEADAGRAAAALRAGGYLPVGKLGEVMVQAELDLLRPVAERLRAL